MRPILVSVALLLLPPIAAAQRPSRFVPIEIDGDPERILNQQLLRIQALENLKRDLLKGIDLRELLDRLKKSGITPDQVPQFLDDPQLKKSLAKELAKFKEDLKKLAEQNGPEPGAVPAPMAQLAEPAAPAARPLPKPQPKHDLEEKFLRWLSNRMEDLEGSRLAQILGESPAWTEALRDLRLSLLDREGPFRMGEWAERWLPDASRAFEGLRLPELPAPPALNLRLPEIHGPALPRLGAPSLPGAGFFTALQWVLWIILAIAVALALAYLWRRRQEGAAGERNGWRLGPWPVDPAHISTAAELIQAFEYLALARLGLDAQACNHRRLAQRLAPPEEPAPARQAVHQLAGLYEQARYAPDAVLPPESLAGARRHLCLLAGRAAS